ncbi:MAG: hypothetical protein R8M71_03925 [Alphaproteobacteria bacterium]|nr:hypothetical protein [Alphaproteobacteria bacterium]
MKPYFAISFLIAFMQIYALGAEEVNPTAGDSEGDQNPTETVITTCTVSASGPCNGKPCDKFSGTKEVSVGTHVLCTENCWLRCDKNDSGTNIVEAKVAAGTDTFTPCGEGFIFHGDKCLSCTDLTGEKNATSEAGKATTMSDCTIKYVQGATYQDEKGTFEYLSECAIGCTEETEYYCTSV